MVVTPELISPTKPEMPSWQLCPSSFTGGQRRTGQPQTHGKHKDVVEYHIEQAAAQGSHHGKGGVAVVAHKGRHDIVAHEEGREHKEDAGIRDAQRHDPRVTAHQPQKAAGRKNAHQQERHAEHTGAEDGIVDRQAEVEQGHAVGTRRLRDEIGIGQNVARGAQQAEDIL